MVRATNRSLWLVVAMRCMAPCLVQAQQRGGSHEVREIVVRFETAVMFQTNHVGPGRYRISISNRGLSLVEPTTMVQVALIPYVESVLQVPVTHPVAKVVVKRGEVTILVRMDDRLYTSKGKPTVPITQDGHRVQLASKRDVLLGDILPKEKETRLLIEDALKRRYVREVKHCGKEAHKRHWETDNKRFWNCACPLTHKWRLPHESKPLRVHTWLLKGRNGLMLTVTPKGKVEQCRVWSGRAPPTEENPEVKAVAKESSPP